MSTLKNSKARTVVGNLLTHLSDSKLLAIIITSAFFFYMWLIVLNGTYLCLSNNCGYYFWGAHGHDAMWHFSIANISFKTIPISAPTFAGQNLYGYNWGYDFIVFILKNLGLNPLFIYFKMIPIMWFMTFTVLLIKLSKKIINTRLFTAIFLFITYFGTSCAYVITLIKNRTMVGSAELINEIPMHTMSNPPYAISILLFLTLVILITDTRLTFKKILLSCLCVFFIFGTKFYGGVVCTILLFAKILLENLPSNLNKFILHTVTLVFFLLLSVIFFYNPFDSLSTGLPLTFSPLALVHPLTEDPLLLYMKDLTNARYFLNTVGISKKLIAIETFNLALFIFIYFGTKVLGLVYALYLIIKKGIYKFDAVIITTILSSIVLTVSLVQKAEWWNTIQFIFYGILLSNIYLSRLIYSLIQSKVAFVRVCAFMLIFASVPITIDMLKLPISKKKVTYLPKNEILALKFLSEQKDGVVLSPLYKKTNNESGDILPIYRTMDSAYIAAFSGKQEYFSDLVQLRLTDVPYMERQQRMLEMDCTILNEIDYIYETRQRSRSDKWSTNCKMDNFRVIYKNTNVIIFSKHR